MTTLLDSGLLEDCLDDPISLFEFDQLPVINLDNISATIEEPGYILDDATELYSSIDQEEKSVALNKKTSFTLPATFFDINRNIRLLKKCRPISIKIVDCDVYPWYYKKSTNLVNSTYAISNNEELLHQRMLNDYTVGLPYRSIQESLNSTLLTSPKIDLSIEQKSVVLQLKEEMEQKLTDIKQNVNNVVRKEIQSFKNLENNTQIIKTNSSNLSEFNNRQSVQEINKNIEIGDLLTYKAIAQTIVRNIEYSEEGKKINFKNMCVPYKKGNGVDLCNKDIMLINKEKKKREKNTESKKNNKANKSSNIMTSPILPCKSRPQKKTNSKHDVLKKFIKSNDKLEKCYDSKKCSDKVMPGTNKLIPHYHYRMPFPTIGTNDYYFSKLNYNQMYSQEMCSRDINWQSHVYENISSWKYDSIPTHDYQNKEVASSSSFGELSHFEYYNKPFNNSVITNPKIPAPIIDYNNKYDYANSSSCQNSSPRQAAKFPYHDHFNSRSSLRLVRRPSAKASKENSHVLCHPYTPNKHLFDYCAVHSASTLNDYHYYNKTEVPITGGGRNTENIITTNPMLTHLLNTNNTNEYYQSASEQSSVISPHTIVESNPYQISGLSYDLTLRPPLPSYEEYLASPSFAYNGPRYPQYPWSGIYTGSSENLNLGKNTTEPVPTNRTINENEQQLMTKDNSRNSSIDTIKIKNVTPTTLDSIVCNTSSFTEAQMLNHISCAETFEITNKKALNPVNTKVSQNGVQFSDLFKAKDINILKQNIIDTNTNKLIDDSEANGKFSVKRILRPSDVITKATSKCDNILQPIKDTNVVNSEHIDYKKIGYSPPILPIPSFKKSLEMISESPNCHSMYTKNHSNLETETYKKKTYEADNGYEYMNIIRKRKLSDEQKNLNNKRISLQEYQLRRLEATEKT